jgi:hypothetical protein
MAALSDDVKVGIVTALACFDSPKQVIEDARARYGITLTYQQVDFYNPSSKNGQRLAVRYKDLFKVTREQFLKDVGSIPIALVAVRLRALDRMMRNAMDKGNAKLAAALMEQAAKEVGGAYTNRRELSGPNGGAIPLLTAPISPDERDELVRRTLAEF